ncbi:hypothetical protein BM536_032025 [Streptomyces phaeoluteigriseus]|uniref:Uncharacterized protein n=1 Tax=Streptomyces phaeoluteigriseus TaxID=114686 RepID=A0A1V6MJW2_9ACTN|nr:hypothetical protein [Streptomyces phaeoluteigriseus]OQD52739.1 hypothetical protein BM536_032025 [Streptomyces phaeoluteigriseus]
MSRGTWHQMEAWGRWLSGASHKQESGLVRLGVILRRLLLSLLVVVFYGALLQRVPGGIYAVPLVWAVGAWQMSDWSAPPPPRSTAPLVDSYARESGRVREVRKGPGEGMTIFPEIEYVDESGEVHSR